MTSTVALNTQIAVKYMTDIYFTRQSIDDYCLTGSAGALVKINHIDREMETGYNHCTPFDYDMGEPSPYAGLGIAMHADDTFYMMAKHMCIPGRECYVKNPTLADQQADISLIHQ